MPASDWKIFFGNICVYIYLKNDFGARLFALVLGKFFVNFGQGKAAIAGVL